MPAAVAPTTATIGGLAGSARGHGVSLAAADRAGPTVERMPDLREDEFDEDYGPDDDPAPPYWFPGNAMPPTPSGWA